MQGGVALHVAPCSLHLAPDFNPDGQVRTVIITVAVLLGGMSGTAHAQPLPQDVEAISFLGDTLRRPALSPAAQQRYDSLLAVAQQAYDRTPGNPDSIVWLGRRTAYLGRYREAIEIFTRGITHHPSDARMYRHRGHRFITTRQLDLAISDFERAVSLTEGSPDEVEPDGLPNPRNIPTSTLQSNIWYHLALAHYLRGDFPRALDAWRRCLEVAGNPDMLVATSHWLYMTLRRMGRNDEAAKVLDPIHPDLDVIENHAYFRLLLMYKGLVTADDVVRLGEDGEVSLEDVTAAYGVANWHLYNDRGDEAYRLFRRIVNTPQWAAFGYIAAEAELARGN